MISDLGDTSGVFFGCSVADVDPGSTLQGLTAHKGRGATEAARRTLFSPCDATIGTTNLAALLNFSANAPSLFRIPLHRTVSPPIAHAGDRGSASSRIALPRPSRVDELPMSAQSKYGANQRVRQQVIWSFFDFRKSPIKACEPCYVRHRRNVSHPPDH